MKHWTIFTVIDEAAKHPNRSTFAKMKRNAYNVAKELGMLDQLFPPVKRVVKVLHLSPAPLSIDTFEPTREQNRALNSLAATGNTSEFFRFVGSQPITVRSLLVELAREENPRINMSQNV